LTTDTFMHRPRSVAGGFKAARRQAAVSSMDRTV
jgi:hypothetical protein